MTLYLAMKFLYVISKTQAKKEKKTEKVGFINMKDLCIKDFS